MADTLSMAHYTALYNLVKELAESHPYNPYRDCHYCAETYEESYTGTDKTNHDPDCLWVRAKALVQ